MFNYRAVLILDLYSQSYYILLVDHPVDAKPALIKQKSFFQLFRVGHRLCRTMIDTFRALLFVTFIKRLKVLRLVEKPKGTLAHMWCSALGGSCDLVEAAQKMRVDVCWWSSSIFRIVSSLVPGFQLPGMWLIFPVSNTDRSHLIISEPCSRDSYNIPVAPHCIDITERAWWYSDNI